VLGQAGMGLAVLALALAAAAFLFWNLGRHGWATLD
jgi:hypothetical protein